MTDKLKNIYCFGLLGCEISRKKSQKNLQWETIFKNHNFSMINFLKLFANQHPHCLHWVRVLAITKFLLRSHTGLLSIINFDNPCK